MTKLKCLVLVFTCSTCLLAFKANTDFEQLIAHILNQLEQQSESDQRLINQTRKLRESVQAAEDRLARNQLGPARQQALEREAMVAANEIITNPKRTKLELDSFLRRAHSNEEEILERAVDGPAATRLTTTRLAAQVKARQDLLSDFRRDVEALKKFPTAQERIQFLKDHVELIWQVVRERSGGNVQ